MKTTGSPAHFENFPSNLISCESGVRVYAAAFTSHEQRFTSATLLSVSKKSRAWCGLKISPFCSIGAECAD